MLQLGHITRKILLALYAVATQGAHGHLIGARCAPKSEIDTPRIQLGERAKRFGHHQLLVAAQIADRLDRRSRDPRGTLEVAHAAWPHLVQQGYGRMVLTASSAGLHANHGQSAYSAAKAAVIGLMRALAIEGRRHQIRVNVIAPYGYSQMTAPYMPPDMARSFDPALVAPLVSWLCSEACDTTGEVLVSGAGLVRRAGVGESDALPLQDGSVADAVHGLESKALQPYGSANDSFARFLQELARMSPPTHPSTTP